MRQRSDTGQVGVSALITCLAAIPCWVRNLSDADAYMALVLANTQGEPWFVLADVYRVDRKSVV